MKFAVKWRAHNCKLLSCDWSIKIAFGFTRKYGQFVHVLEISATCNICHSYLIIVTIMYDANNLVQEATELRCLLSQITNWISSTPHSKNSSFAEEDCVYNIKLYAPFYDVNCYLSTWFSKYACYVSLFWVLLRLPPSSSLESNRSKQRVLINFYKLTNKYILLILKYISINSFN